MPDRAESTQLIKKSAGGLGFALCGVAPAVAGIGDENLAGWLAAGRHGEMTYMEAHAAARSDPDRVLEGVASVIVVALGYRTSEPRQPAPGEARISRYAWGRDYHDVMHDRLKSLVSRLQEILPDERFRGVVDSAPVMERDFARLAGLGWFGKNTLLLNRSRGSWFFLGALLTTAVLEYDQPFAADHCGSCTRCLDACPTDAFDGPWRLDPRKCISYLTIESRSPAPEELRPLVGDWLYGCDVCQDVCPWNRKSPADGGPEFAPLPGGDPADLREVLQLTDAEFRKRYRGSPIFRIKRNRLVRNAAVVAGNQRRRELLPELLTLRTDEDYSVRDAAAWAVRQIEESVGSTTDAALI